MSIDTTEETREQIREGESLEESVSRFNENFNRLEKEVGRVIVGMQEVVRHTAAAVFAGGHVLLEGVPGLGKTLLVKSISSALGLSFKRIQFTPDLMPSDVTGTQVLTEDENGVKDFVFKAGPIFANIVLADEVNRATPKTQSALLQAMEERQVTVLGETYNLPLPFFVLATQNPVELEGTYPLPEAQLDRFLLKLIVTPPSSDELKEILNRTTGTTNQEAVCIFDPEKASEQIIGMRSLVRKVVVAEPLQEVLVRMTAALTPGSKFATEMAKKYVRFGPGPRGAQAIILMAKVLALLDSRINVAYEDIKSAITPCLRHRLILNFQAEADGVTSDDIIAQVKKAK